MEAAFALFELAGFAGFALAIYLASKKEGLWNVVAFMLPAVLWSWVVEFTNQALMHGYRYGGGFLLYLPEMPLCIALAWSVLIYCGYRFSTRILKLENKFKIAVSAAVSLVMIDFLFFEPLAKAFGFWAWTPEGVWFGAPSGNFVGWFMMAFLYALSWGFISERTKDAKRRFIWALAFVPLNFAIGLLVLGLWTGLFGIRS